jgi:hypothetical protein
VSYSNYRIILAIAAAAVAACFLTIMTATADQVEAGAQIVDGRTIGPQCSQLAWPFYEDHCLRDRRPRSAQIKSFRVVTTERE